MTSMLHSARSSQADADDTEVILGVDTHKDTHVAAVLNPVGVLLDSRCFAATAAGYQQLLGWAQAFGTVGAQMQSCSSLVLVQQPAEQITPVHLGRMFLGNAR
jgi:hypothetical protein